jgi:pyridinium-3,5-biscarboxylic acid mononucleotide synthase
MRSIYSSIISELSSVTDILSAVRAGKLSIKKAERFLKLDALAIVGDFARLDFNRFLRRGVPEIVYAQNKSVPQIVSIAKKMIKTKLGRPSVDVPIILSRVSGDQAKEILNQISGSDGLDGKLAIRYFAEANIIAIVARDDKFAKQRSGRVALIAAGTSDLPVLNEAEVVLNLLGFTTLRFNDVGVAGLHRLLEPLQRIQKFDPDAIIVAAGMEGALPTVVAGLSSVPVIGLPTSVGYGYGKGGEAALMSMLQACSLGVSVVNIDAGVAAAVVASLISRRAHSHEKSLRGSRPSGKQKS